MEVVRRFQALDPIIKWTTAAMIGFHAIAFASLYIASRRLYIPLPPTVIDWTHLLNKYSEKQGLKELATAQKKAFITTYSLFKVFWYQLERLGTQESQKAFVKACRVPIEQKIPVFYFFYNNDFEPIKQTITDPFDQILCNLIDQTIREWRKKEHAFLKKHAVWIRSIPLDDLAGEAKQMCPQLCAQLIANYKKS